MDRKAFQRESAVEYFKELVEGALANQNVQAGEITAFYVVQLLAGAIRRSADDGEPLALKVVAAAEAAGVRRRALLRQIGDDSLFLSGFFSDSLRRRVVDVDYYASIGGHAYNALSRVEAGAFAPAFEELGRRFGTFVDVLCEVSERTACTSNADLLRLYEKWLRTGSFRCGQLLVEKGLVPNASIRGSFLQ